LLQRSRLADSPLRAINRRTRTGRAIHAIVARLLADVVDPTNPLTVSDCIALAQLRIRADEARRDPACDPNTIVRFEHLIDRRMKRLNLVRSKALTRF
jgi:hypothetical protein